MDNENNPPQFDFVRLEFIKRMESELVTNSLKKGDWKTWRPEKLYLVSEINWHLAKLIQALDSGDQNKITEYAADVANYMMKTDEIYGRKPADNQDKENESK